MDVIEKLLPEKYRARNAVVDNLQKKINAYCLQAQMNNSENIGVFGMRVEPLSNCEKAFYLQSFAENTRIDARKCDEFREAKVVVGLEFGSALAMLGETKQVFFLQQKLEVLAQVSCSVVEPSSVRGNMGKVEVQVNMSPMASPDFEDGRLGSKGLQLIRILELLYRDCGVLDLESLCLRKFKQVWQIRVDVHILSADGSLVDCACIASLAALAHFRRPDVSVLPDSILIHSSTDKPPIPLNMYHMPVCVTFGITADGLHVTDPTDKEEQCLKGTLIVAANKRHEICALHQSGNFSLSEHLIVQCVNRAIQRALDISDLINSIIIDDKFKRTNRQKIKGFIELAKLDVLISYRHEPNELIAPGMEVDTVTIPLEDIDVGTTDDIEIHYSGEKTLVTLSSNEETTLMEQVQSIVSMEEAQKADRDMEEVDELLQGIAEEFEFSN
ncbi:unnamed protein product [Thelazia callipaeda]|uniref:Exosome complex component RRP45 n=1 Tax=Thelazia callipaeda TaxID=103827 RepID=A0A0N5CLW9_THECL|nr:unnamed protein product [Thelazia callipaeda]